MYNKRDCFVHKTEKCKSNNYKENYNSYDNEYIKHLCCPSIHPKIFIGPTGSVGTAPFSTQGVTGEIGPTGESGYEGIVVNSGVTINPIIFSTETITNNGYDPSTGIFTVQKTGNYYFNAKLVLTGTTSSIIPPLKKIILNINNGKLLSEQIIYTSTIASTPGFMVGQYVTMHISKIISLNKGDKIQISFQNDTNYPIIIVSNESIFEGYRLN